jgi:protein-disulfide isomerase
MSSRTDRPRPSRSYRRARGVGILVIVALVLGIAWVATRGGNEGAAPAGHSPTASDAASSTASGTAPANRTADGWIAVGDGPVTVAIYFDYLCPACGAFEEANGEELDRLLAEGAVTVELRPIAFLDHLSDGTEYSTRAANALATVADGAPEHAWALHRALYAAQPAEGGPGLTDAELEELAVEAGAPADVAATFAERRFDDWVAERTKRAFADGIEGTPTIVVDGEIFTGDPYAPGDLTTAVEQASA